MGLSNLRCPKRPIRKGLALFPSLGRKCHLPSIISQEANDRGEDEYENGIDRMDAGDVLAQAVPVDENKLKTEKKGRKLNLFFDIVGEFQSIIDPPCEESRGHCKGRGDCPQD